MKPLFTILSLSCFAASGSCDCSNFVSMEQSHKAVPVGDSWESNSDGSISKLKRSYECFYSEYDVET